VPEPNRRIANDTRGYVAEYAARTIRKGSASEDGLDAAQRRKALDLLVKFGALDRTTLTYHGSTRSGLAKPINVLQPEVPIAPLDIDSLLTSDFWKHGFYQDVEFRWQATLFQPVGGMDTIWRRAAAFLRRDGKADLRLNSPVDGIALHGDTVAVRWREADGSRHDEHFDFCLSNIPLSVLRENVHLEGFSDPFVDAVRHVPFDDACKVGWQADKRFWESEKYQIYGGISRVDNEIEQVWYPSNDYFTDKGTLTGAYASGRNGTKLGNLTHAQRLDLARRTAAKLQPEFADPRIIPEKLGMSIAWQRVPYQLGAWADWNPKVPEHKSWYETLLYPQGQNTFLVIGDQLSVLPGWQEGALMSAEWAYEQITRGARAARVPVTQVPDARAVTTGDTAEG
jgi:monoamine oxidase